MEPLVATGEPVGVVIHRNEREAPSRHQDPMDTAAELRTIEKAVKALGDVVKVDRNNLRTTAAIRQRDLRILVGVDILAIFSVQLVNILGRIEVI